MDVYIDMPRVEETDGKYRLKSTVFFGDNKKDLYIETDRKYSHFFDAEVVDGFVVSILPYCMILAKIMKVTIKSPGRISKRLLFQLQRYYIPVVAKNVSYYGKIEIKIEPIEKLYESFAIATGVSGGVDSCYSIACNLNGTIQELTHLVYIDLGIHGSKEEKSLQSRCRRIAEQVELPMIKIKTNVCSELYQKAYAPVVHAVFAGVILSFPQLFRVYYYSGTLSAKDFHFDEADAADYELFTLPCFSTDNLTFYSSGTEATRLEKVKYIASKSFAQKNLFVCLNIKGDGSNCNRCAKCTRTLCELDVANSLEDFKEVFDIEDYRKNLSYHWGYVLLKSWVKDPYYTELIAEKKKEGIIRMIPFYISAINKFVKRGFSIANKKSEKVWERIKSEYEENN